jgi:hypothetical protein
LDVLGPSDYPVLAVVTALFGDDAVRRHGVTKGEQYLRVCRTFHDDNPGPLPYSVIGQLFRVDKETVTKLAKKFTDRSINSDRDLGRGRSPILNPSQPIALRTCIMTAYKKHRPGMTYQIRRYVNEDLCINVSTNTLVHIFARDPDVES